MKLQTINEWINEAKITKALITKTLGKYKQAFEKTFDKNNLDTLVPIRYEAKYIAWGIDCGNKISQYKLQTKFGWSVLDAIDNDKNSVIYVRGTSVIYASKGTIKLNEQTIFLDNDKHKFIAAITPDLVINNSEEWVEYIRSKGISPYQSKSFKKSTKVDFFVVSVKGVERISDIKDNVIKQLSNQ